MNTEKQQQDDRAPETPAPPKAEPGIAQVGNQKVKRPEKVSDRDMPDDVNE